MKRKSALMKSTGIRAVLALAGALVVAPQFAFAGDLDEGKEIAFDRKKGNCLACHAIAGGDLPGNIGPELKNMKSRFPNKADLRAQIFDPTSRNPYTSMPPYGKHKIVSDAELDKIVEFIYSL